MRLIPQGSAVDVVVGVFVDYADGVTICTTANSVGQMDTCYIFQGTVITSISSRLLTHKAAGYYTFPLLASEVATLGNLVLTFADADKFVPVWGEFVVVSTPYYDAMCGDNFHSQISSAAMAALNTAMPNTPTAGSINWETERARMHLTNKVEVDDVNDKMYVFADDGATAISTFALQDKDDNPSDTNVYKRVPE